MSDAEANDETPDTEPAAEPEAQPAPAPLAVNPHLLAGVHVHVVDAADASTERCLNVSGGGPRRIFVSQEES